MRLAIDGNNWCHKDFHGSGVDKVAPNFLNRLAGIRSKFSDILIAFDGGRSFRYDLFAGYKEGREDKPDLDAAMSELKVTLGRDYDVAEIDGLEADDLIANYVGLAVKDGVKAVIASSDKDLHQLLLDGAVAQMTSIRKRMESDGGGYECEFMTEKMLIEKYHVMASQWVEYRMLTGDPSDKIPGCKGIGPETASKVISTCGSLEAFWAVPHGWGFSKSVVEKLIAFQETSELFRQLMDLRLDQRSTV